MNRKTANRFLQIFKTDNLMWLDAVKLKVEDLFCFKRNVRFPIFPTNFEFFDSFEKWNIEWKKLSFYWTRPKSIRTPENLQRKEKLRSTQREEKKTFDRTWTHLTWQRKSKTWLKSFAGSFVSNRNAEKHLNGPRNISMWFYHRGVREVWSVVWWHTFAMDWCWTLSFPIERATALRYWKALQPIFWRCRELRTSRNQEI